MKYTFAFLNIALIIFLVCCYFVVNVASNKPGIAASCYQSKSFIYNNHIPLQKVFSETFSQNMQCANQVCRKELVQNMFQTFTGSEKMVFFPSSYFIRLNADQNIEKLFFSGELQTTIPETRKEKLIVKLLKGQAEARCTQGWKMDASDTQMTYLKDFPSAEAEIIVPILDINGKVVGAMVSAFGD